MQKFKEKKLFLSFSPQQGQKDFSFLHWDSVQPRFLGKAQKGCALHQDKVPAVRHRFVEGLGFGFTAPLDKVPVQSTAPGLCPSPSPLGMGTAGRSPSPRALPSPSPSPSPLGMGMGMGTAGLRSSPSPAGKGSEGGWS
jgi:hypothetical protein